MGHPNCFGIRHLSPAGAYHLRGFLDEKQPDLILVEGPSDFNGLMDDMVREETKPPFARRAALMREQTTAAGMHPPSPARYYRRQKSAVLVYR